VLTPHEGVFDRTAFDDDLSGQERDDLVLEPIVVDRPVVSYPREPTPAYLSEPAPTYQSPRATYPIQPSHANQSRRSPTYLSQPQPEHGTRPSAYVRAPANLREPDPTLVPTQRATRTYPPPSTSNRRAPPGTRSPTRRPVHSHRRREGAGLEPNLGHGIPGRGVILLGLLAALGLAAADIALNRELTLFFSLGFVLIGLICAMSVRRSDLFTAGVLPPLLLAAVVGVCAVAMPSAVGAPSGSINNAWVSGLAHHAGGLVSAHAAALLMIALRMLNEPARRTRAF
jgi:hypothetical protein